METFLNSFKFLLATLFFQNLSIYLFNNAPFYRWDYFGLCLGVFERQSEGNLGSKLHARGTEFRPRGFSTSLLDVEKPLGRNCSRGVTLHLAIFCGMVLTVVNLHSLNYQLEVNVNKVVLNFLLTLPRGVQVSQSQFQQSREMSNQDKSYFPHFATKLLHEGQEPEKWNSRAVIPPISLATTFKQDSPGVHRVC